MNKPVDASAMESSIGSCAMALRPLTSVQQVIWPDQVLSSDIPNYHIGMVVMIDDEIDRALLGQAINHVDNHSGGLRLVTSEDPGVVAQRVLPSVEVDLPTVDFSGHDDGEQQAWRLLYAAGVRPAVRSAAGAGEPDPFLFSAALSPSRQRRRGHPPDLRRHCGGLPQLARERTTGVRARSVRRARRQRGVFAVHFLATTGTRAPGGVAAHVRLSADIDGLSEQDLQRLLAEEEAGDVSPWKPICAG